MRKAFLLAVSLLTAACTEGAPPADTAPAYMADDSWRGIDRALLDASLPILTEAFFDADSVKLRRLMLPAKPLASLCGAVNAKNRMGAYVGFRPFFITAAAGDNRAAAFVIDPNPENAEQVAMEASMIMLCPGWEPFASEAARDMAYLASIPDDDIPASIRGFCRASEVKLDDVRKCINGQLLLSLKARKLLDDGHVTEEQYRVCLNNADKAAGYSDLNDVQFCMERYRSNAEYASDAGKQRP